MARRAFHFATTLADVASLSC